MRFKAVTTKVPPAVASAVIVIGLCVSLVLVSTTVFSPSPCLCSAAIYVSLVPFLPTARCDKTLKIDAD